MKKKSPLESAGPAEPATAGAPLVATPAASQLLHQSPITNHQTPDTKRGSTPLSEALAAAWQSIRGHTYELSWKDGQRLRNLLKHGDAEVLRRWGIALRWKGFPACNSVADLEGHWNAYGKEQEPAAPKGTLRANVSDEEFREASKHLKTDENGDVVFE